MTFNQQADDNIIVPLAMVKQHGHRTKALDLGKILARLWMLQVDRVA
jgi:hypothetical protein